MKVYLMDGKKKWQVIKIDKVMCLWEIIDLMS
jgi:hypothetical protein